MLLLNALHRIARTVAPGVLLLAPLAAHPQDQADPRAASSPQALAATLQRGERVGNEQVLRQFITCGTNQFLFVVPPGLRSEATRADTLALASADSRYFLNLAVFGSARDTLASAAIEARRKDVLKQYPGAEKLEEFTSNVAGREAQGLQLRQHPPGAGDRLVRIIWAPCPGGFLEFTLNAAADKATQGLQALDGILVTFRTNENGKIEIVRRTEAS